MVIIAHRYFKSQVFYFLQTESFGRLLFNHINDSMISERTFSMPPGLSDSTW